MAVTEHPRGIIPREASLTLRLTPIQTKTVKGKAPPCTVPMFFLWKVITKNPVNDEALKVSTVPAAGNVGAPIAYPDGCFKFEIFLVGCLPSGKCVEWSSVFFNATPAPDVLDGLNLYTDQEQLPTGKGCNGVAVVYAPSWPSPFGTLVGTFFEVDPIIDGTDFGPGISFACDTAAFATAWANWVQAVVDLATQVVTTSQLTFQQTPDGTLQYYVELVGLLWDNPDAVTWVVVQTAGVAVPDASYFQVVSADCGRWNIVLTNGYDYSGTAFQIEATYAANPFGSSIAWTCEV